jgi:hypothetical protein
MHPTPQNDAHDAKSAQLMHAMAELDAGMHPVTEPTRFLSVASF